ncbi:MAG: aspartate aminotransferase family protein [Myxococcales bacterium]|nr:aspartate aminotransferase family protein [Myxococcales bacterium]MCB9642526.1 aspartate aminotransferase family protein [Myxococcales bacterium]
MKIPSKALSQEELFAQLESFRQNDLKWREGRAWGYVYDAGREVEDVAKKAFMMYLSENGLDPTSFPSLAILENQIVSMARDHLHGDEDVVGNFTSGGTESIILAVKTARDRFYAMKPDAGQAEMILPISAHAAFYKAAHYLGVKVVQTAIDPETKRADVDAVRAAITDRTALIVGSATSYAWGVVDPIEEIAKVAQEHGILCHVDGCIGGFLLQYYRRLGEDIPLFDFRVPGVTSISMDLHKYAFAPKGASVVLHRNKDLRRYQIFACASWTGYSIINTAVQSSKSGGPMAAAWAVMNFIGDDGYMRYAQEVLDEQKKLVAGIKAIKDLNLPVEPQMPLIAIDSDTVGVFHVIDEMKMKGWYVQPQLSYQGHKPCFHLLVSPSHRGKAEIFLEDLASAVELAKDQPESELAANVKEMFGQITPDQITEDVLQGMLGMAGIQGDGLPERMAEVNEVLNSIPTALVERLLTEFMNDLFTPTK